MLWRLSRVVAVSFSRSASVKCEMAPVKNRVFVVGVGMTKVKQIVLVVNYLL